jgi:hypothetical protein
MKVFSSLSRLDKKDGVNVWDSFCDDASKNHLVENVKIFTNPMKNICA